MRSPEIDASMADWMDTKSPTPEASTTKVRKGTARAPRSEGLPSGSGKAGFPAAIIGEVTPSA